MTAPNPLTELAERPIRIQRKRTAGWKMPPNTVYVGRPGIFGNYAAHRAGLPRTGQSAEDAFRKWVEAEASEAWKGNVVSQLRGKNLACWCGLGLPCHANVLLEIANAPDLRARAASENSHHG